MKRCLEVDLSRLTAIEGRHAGDGKIWTLFRGCGSFGCRRATEKALAPKPYLKKPRRDAPCSVAETIDMEGPQQFLEMPRIFEEVDTSDGGSVMDY